MPPGKSPLPMHGTSGQRSFPRADVHAPPSPAAALGSQPPVLAAPVDVAPQRNPRRATGYPRWQSRGSLSDQLLSPVSHPLLAEQRQLAGGAQTAKALEGGPPLTRGGGGKGDMGV